MGPKANIIIGQKNSLEFNYLKYAIITFCKSNCVKYSYSLDGNELARLESIKDLVIYFDSYFTFEDHIEYVTNKASKYWMYSKMPWLHIDFIIERI